jgi:hypothetical protein
MKSFRIIGPSGEPQARDNWEHRFQPLAETVDETR